MDKAAIRKPKVSGSNPGGSTKTHYLKTDMHTDCQGGPLGLMWFEAWQITYKTDMHADCMTVQGADHSRALKGLTHHKLAPGAELTVQGADHSRALKGLTHHKLAPGAELTV